MTSLQFIASDLPALAGWLRVGGGAIRLMSAGRSQGTEKKARRQNGGGQPCATNGKDDAGEEVHLRSLGDLAGARPAARNAARDPLLPRHLIGLCRLAALALGADRQGLAQEAGGSAATHDGAIRHASHSAAAAARARTIRLCNSANDLPSAYPGSRVAPRARSAIVACAAPVRSASIFCVQPAERRSDMMCSQSMGLSQGARYAGMMPQGNPCVKCARMPA